MNRIVDELIRRQLVKPARQYRKWSPDFLNTLQGLIDAGLSNEEIAVELGYKNAKVVASKLAQHGMSRRRTIRWTPERLQKMAALIASGLTNRQIAIDATLKNCMGLNPCLAPVNLLAVLSIEVEG